MMHGRMKVKTTADHQKAQKEERSRKLNQLKTALSTIFTEREKGSHNLELLNDIAEVLSKIPEMYTLWNYRREIVKSIVDDATVCQAEKETILSKELDVVVRCLVQNAKAYAVWHYREWIILQTEVPDWNMELELCNKALLLDERNFHCWDYRRFVVERGGLSPEKELMFADRKVTANISNYSSWHYRSTLLPQVHGDGVNIDGVAMSDELDVVHNAVFTDPSDQSPWFYYWWLLGRGERKTYLREVYLSRNLERLLLAFTIAETRETLNNLDVEVKALTDKGEVLLASQKGGDETTCKLPWKPALFGDVSAIWWLPLDKNDMIDCCVEAVIRWPGRVIVWRCVMGRDQGESLVRVELDPFRLVNPAISPDKKPDSLSQELTTVRDLRDLAPRNKWVLLSLLSLLRFTNPRDSEEEVDATLKVLTQEDPARQRYYADLRSRYAIEDALSRVYVNHKRMFELPSVGLTRLYCLEWLPLMTRINLSGNTLESLPEEFAYMICLEEANLDGNQLQSLAPLRSLTTLRWLSVQNNLIADFAGLEPILYCPQLRVVQIRGNAVTAVPDLTQLFATHPCSKLHSHSLSIAYDKTIAL